MLRLIFVIVLLGFHHIASAQNLRPAQYVNLNASGAMEQIRAANRAHYEKIQAIMEASGRNRTERVPSGSGHPSGRATCCIAAFF